jgi:hypothetical protein
MLERRLLLKLPEEIIVNHILPYTYSPITFELSQDIKDYVGNITKLNMLYSTTHTHIVLFRCLITYLRLISRLSENIFISQKFIEIMSRHIMLQKCSHEQVSQYILKRIVEPEQINYTRFFSVLFGLMNVHERKNFMEDISHAETLHIIPGTTPELE